jgi:hypothetical protein
MRGIVLGNFPRVRQVRAVRTGSANTSDSRSELPSTPRRWSRRYATAWASAATSRTR